MCAAQRARMSHAKPSMVVCQTPTKVALHRLCCGLFLIAYNMHCVVYGTPCASCIPPMLGLEASFIKGMPEVRLLAMFGAAGAD
jgi:hypothetical protein